jgi:hypothetical protein
VSPSCGLIDEPSSSRNVYLCFARPQASTLNQQRWQLTTSSSPSRFSHGSLTSAHPLSSCLSIRCSWGSAASTSASVRSHSAPQRLNCLLCERHSVLFKCRSEAGNVALLLTFIVQFWHVARALCYVACPECTAQGALAQRAVSEPALRAAAPVTVPVECCAYVAFVGTAVTLCGMHFLSCGAGLATMKMLGIMASSTQQIPLKGVRSLPPHVMLETLPSFMVDHTSQADIRLHTPVTSCHRAPQTTSHGNAHEKQE